MVAVSMIAIVREAVWKLVRSTEVLTKYIGMKASQRMQRLYTVMLINLASLKFCGTLLARKAKYVVTIRRSKLYAKVTESPI